MRRQIVIACLFVVIRVAGASVPSAHAARDVAPRQRDPVLLVHGFRGSSDGWQALVTSLEARGYHPSEIDAIDYDDDASNVEVAHQIAREVAALRARTGAARIDVVSHSMGAISSRYYLQHLGGAGHVDAWVSLAGVNEGTLWAYGCYVLAPCREMVPTAPILEHLNDDGGAGAPTRYGAWWSPCDEAIVPEANAELAGAHNVETGCLGHTAMLSDPKVLAQVMQFLEPRTFGS